jgi:PAS domain S-box-containing protein
VTVETFWYRRITEIAVILASVSVTIWLWNGYVSSSTSLAPYVISDMAAYASMAVLAMGTLTIILQRRKRVPLLVAATISLLAAAILLSIASTGDMSSPYIPLWVIVALFSAVGGIASFSPLTLALITYAGYLVVQDTLKGSDWINFIVALVIPVMVGFFIWHRRFQGQDRSNQAMSRLARQLSNESSKSEIIINAIADGVVVIDTNNIIQLINPAAEQIIGWGKEDATGLDYRSVMKIIDDQDQVVTDQIDPVQQCLSTNKSVITEKFGLRTVSGKQLFASILVSPISETGSGVIVVFRDITSQRVEERGKAEFISTASHEMRTPVAAIEGYLGLALNPQTAAIDDKARTYLGKAHESAQHLGQLFQDLLDISKAEDGRLNNKPGIVNIPEIVRCIVEDFESQAKEKGLGLLYAPENSKTGTMTIEPIYYANVDQTHFKEIISNLISNALKYSREGTVIVDVTGDDNHIFISVKDTGIGIPAEDLPHLFQKFYRVDNTDTREIGGTGLGLYLSRKLAESMDGHLNVESTYGKGSTFTVDVPRVSREDAEEAKAKAALESAPAPGSSLPTPVQAAPVQSVAVPVAMPTAQPPTTPSQTVSAPTPTPPVAVTQQTLPQPAPTPAAPAQQPPISPAPQAVATPVVPTADIPPVAPVQPQPPASPATATAPPHQPPAAPAQTPAQAPLTEAPVSTSAANTT